MRSSLHRQLLHACVLRLQVAEGGPVSLPLRLDEAEQRLCHLLSSSARRGCGQRHQRCRCTRAVGNQQRPQNGGCQLRVGSACCCSAARVM